MYQQLFSPQTRAALGPPGTNYFAGAQNPAAMNNVGMSTQANQTYSQLSQLQQQRPIDIYQWNANKTPGLNTCGISSDGLVCQNRLPTYIPSELFPQNQMIVVPEQTIYKKRTKNKCKCGNPACKHHKRKPERREIMCKPIPIMMGRPAFSVRLLVGSPSEAGNVPAGNADPNLIGSRGMIKIGTKLFVSNAWTDLITSYNAADGSNLNSKGISIRSTRNKTSFPSGLVAAKCNQFTTANVVNADQYASDIISACETGAIHSASSTIDTAKAILRYNQEAMGITHTYTGITVRNDLLYVADLFNGSIDLYNSNFEPVNPGSIGYFSFIDPATPAIDTTLYAPFNITNIGDSLFVCWAKKNKTNRLMPDFSGGGFISEFSGNGKWIRRFASEQTAPLVAPWAIIQAPIGPNFPENGFLVGNVGSGRILIFNACGEFKDYLRNGAGEPLTIQGLWELVPDYCRGRDGSCQLSSCGGNDPNVYGSNTSQNPFADKIYFTASKDPDTNGLVGVLEKLSCTV